MPRKCCAGHCKSNYDGESEKVKVFSFPTDDLRREAWRRALNCVLKDDEITKNMGVCIKHWPEGFETYNKKGHDLPINPPSIFATNPSFSGKSVSEDRQVSKRKVDYDSRRKSVEKRSKERDTFVEWFEIVEYARKKAGLVFLESENGFHLIRIDGNPPSVNYSIEVTKDFKISCHKKSSKVPTREELGFAAKFDRFSQLDNIIAKAEVWELDIQSELKSCSQHLASLITDSTDEIIDDDLKHRIQFLSDQLYLLTTEPSGRRYKPETIKDALDLFLRSRNCYSAARNILSLPHPKTLKNYFGHFGTEGSVQECTATVKSVFGTLSGKQLYSKTLFDEMHIKPSIRYRGNHIIGKSADEPDKAAKTILILMACCSMGGPSFVCRLIPVYSLKHEFLTQQLQQLLRILHDCGGYVFLCMSDNLRCNQSTFSDHHKKYGTVKEWSVNHPIKNKEFDLLFLLYDPTHLFKNIRNNWVTEKTQILRFTDPETGKIVEAKWRDLIEIYRDESESYIKNTKLDYASLYPTNFDKQKVHLACNIFNEKTSAELRRRGKIDTAVFVEAVTKLWNILNIKRPNQDKRLNDPNRKEFETADDSRLEYLRKMANAFKAMNTANTGYDYRIKSLTTDTSNALFVTLNGLADLILTFLARGYEYVLPGEFQSDRIEGEIGVYRQQSGGNMYISNDQVLSSLHLQRLKLFKKLEIERSDVHEKEACCATPLDDIELEYLDKCIELSSNLTESEKSTLYYISGYITHKEGLLPSENVLPESIKESEFTQLVSRGQLSHPSADLFELSQYLFSYYKSVPVKSCANRLIVAFQEISEVFASYEYDKSVFRRFANCFSKGYAVQSTDKIKRQKKDQKNTDAIVKKGRLRFY